MVNDPTERTQHELDVVAIDTSTRHRRPRVLVLGEAKHSNRRRGIGDIRRLERIRELVSERDDVDATEAKLAIFSSSGFERNVSQLSRERTDVLLVDLDRIYTGA